MLVVVVKTVYSTTYTKRSYCSKMSHVTFPNLSDCSRCNKIYKGTYNSPWLYILWGKIITKPFWFKHRSNNYTVNNLHINYIGIKMDIYIYDLIYNSVAVVVVYMLLHGCFGNNAPDGWYTILPFFFSIKGNSINSILSIIGYWKIGYSSN